MSLFIVYIADTKYSNDLRFKLFFLLKNYEMYVEKVSHRIINNIMYTEITYKTLEQDIEKDKIYIEDISKLLCKQLDGDFFLKYY
jgi:hypothetical protein